MKKEVMEKIMGTITNEGIFVLGKLPCGVEFEGSMHNSVKMRPIKNQDIIDLKSDIVMKELAKENFSMAGGNPVEAAFAQSNMLAMYSVLFSKVVIEIGTIPKEKLTSKLFKEMYTKDTGYLQFMDTVVNNHDVEEALSGAPLLRMLNG